MTQAQQGPRPVRVGRRAGGDDPDEVRCALQQLADRAQALREVIEDAPAGFGQ